MTVQRNNYDDYYGGYEDPRDEDPNYWVPPEERQIGSNNGAPGAPLPPPVGTDNTGVTGGGVPEPPQKRGYNEQQFKDAWLATQARTRADMDKFLRDHGEFSEGVTASGKDFWKLPGGQGIDALFDESGASAHSQWLVDQGVGAPPPGGAANMPAPYQMAPQNSASAPAPAAAGPRYSDEIYKQIMAMIQRGSQPVTSDDPSIRSQFEPVSNTMQRGGQRAKAAAAERGAFQGTNIGGAGGPLDAQSAAIDEDIAMGEGNLMSELIKSELSARRQEIVNALTIAQGEEKNQLTMQLAQMDNELRRMGMDIQNRQFNQSLTQNANQFGQSLGYNYASLGQQSQQFYDRFDLDRQIQEYIMNQQFNESL